MATTKKTAVKAPVKKTATKTAAKKTVAKKAPAKKAAVKAPTKKVVAKAPVQKFKQVTVDERINDDNREVLVEIRNMDIIFGKGETKVHAVKDLSLNIYKGEVMGIVGESGSGKSTTGNAIMGLVDRAAGSLKIKNREVPNKREKIKGDIKDFMIKTVQMIFQDPASSLNPHKNIYSAVSEGLKNVDVKEIFSRTFDGVTATTIAKIIKGEETPESLKEVDLDWINRQLQAKEFALVEDVIYKRGYEDLLARGTKKSKMAAQFIKMRKAVKETMLSDSDSTKIIERRLVSHILKQVGLSDTILGRYPLEFSGGQQQRVGISRAVVLKPELIIADEPISALDVSIQAQVINIFNELKEKLNLTIVFIAHDLRMVEYVSDRVAVVYQGRLLEVGNAKEIIANPMHPYTRSLISSVPTIDQVHKSLRSEEYKPSVHNYNEQNMPGWFQVNSDKNAEHFVFGTRHEIKKWMGGKNE